MAAICVQLFEQQWAITLLEQTVAKLRGEFQTAGKLDFFEELKIFLTGEKRAVSHAELSAKLGMTEAALKMADSRMRPRPESSLRLARLHFVSDQHASPIRGRAIPGTAGSPGN